MFIDTQKHSEILNTVNMLHTQNTVFEIRMLKTDQKTISGYFDNPKNAAKAIEQYIGKNDIYITLNPPAPALLERSKNALTPFATVTTADREIEKINWLLVDLDPKRASGIASTKDEKREAAVLATIVAQGLRNDYDFPAPIFCDSGNGYHLLYRVDLENTRENVSTLKNVLRALDYLYSTDKVKVDLVTFNPARIVKLYGTMACKGDNTKERPHRWSGVKKIPSSIVPVKAESMCAVIDSLPKADEADDLPVTDAKGKSKKLDIAKKLDEYGLEVAYTKDFQGERDKGIVYVLRNCPWNDEHTNLSARVIQFENGALSAGCFHNSCSGENWHSLRDLMEPEWSDQTKKKEGEGETQFEKVMRICESITLFHNQKEEPLALIPIGDDDHFDIFGVESDKFRKYVSHQYFRETGKAFSADAWKQVVSTISGIALFEGKEERLFKRCAWLNGTAYYDLNDKEKRVIRITKEGWDIEHKTDVLFYRHKTMSEQVVPVKGATNLSILDKHYKFKHADEKILHHVSLITKFLPHIPHPIDVVHGEKGASKTTSLRKDKSIVDPDRCDIWTLPKTRDDLAVLLDKHYFLCFDNLSGISTEMSDLLCMASTGGTYIKRKLYSNNDETVLEFMQPVSLNGVNMVVTKSDLLDRSLLLELDRLSASECKTERELWDDFNADKPKILGMIFSILSKAMRLFPTIKLDKLGRMADFTLWAYAIAEAAGIGGEKFLDAYRRNQEKGNDEAIESHPIAYAIVKFMDARTEWIGTATELLKKLVEIANDEEIDTKSYLWVKQPNQLSRKIREVKSNLEQRGLCIEIKNNGGNRRIRIWKNN